MSSIDLHRLDTLRRKHHDQCCACSSHLYRLDFTCNDGQTLVAIWKPDPHVGSYPNTLHGGIQSLLIDQAMTCCLMAHDVIGVTADLRIRYRHPVTLDAPIEVRTHVTSEKHTLHQLQTEILQHGKRCVLAKGKFMPK